MSFVIIWSYLKHHANTKPIKNWREVFASTKFNPRELRCYITLQYIYVSGDDQCLYNRVSSIMQLSYADYIIRGQ